MEEQEAQPLLTFAEEVGPSLMGLEAETSSRRFEDRYDDLMAAVDWFIAHERADEAHRLVRWLSPFWVSTKRLEEGESSAVRALKLSGGEDASRGHALIQAGFLAFWQGADDRSSARWQEAIRIGQTSGDPGIAAMGLAGLGRVSLRAGDLDASRQLCREALELAERAGDPIGRSSAIHVLGVAAQMAGDLVEARGYMRRQIELARELGSFRGVAMESSNLSMVERQLGNLDSAEELALAALDIAHQREDAWMMPYVFNSLAAVARDRGDHERAATLIGAAEGMIESQGAAWPPDERLHYEKTLATLTAMDAETFERLRLAGRSLSPTDVVAFAARVDSTG